MCLIYAIYLSRDIFQRILFYGTCFKFGPELSYALITVFFFKSIWLLLFSTCQKPKWNNLPITHWTYTTINIIKTDLKFLNPQNTQDFSLCKCVSTCTAVGSVIKNMVINIGDMIYLLSLSWMWKYRVWCIPIIHNIKTTDMKWHADHLFTAMFCFECSWHSFGCHFHMLHPPKCPIHRGTVPPKGVLRCLTPGGGPSVNQILDEIGIWLIWRSGWAIFSHVPLLSSSHIVVEWTVPLMGALSLRCVHGLQWSLAGCWLSKWHPH